MRTMISYGAKETFELGKKLVRLGYVRKGTLIALYGEFGAGKTVLVKGIAKQLGYSATVSSPSFVFANEYLPNGRQAKLKLYHIDLYRINKPEDIINLGLDELFNGSGVCIVEWAEKAGNLLPKKRINIKIKIIGEQIRQIKII